MKNERILNQVETELAHELGIAVMLQSAPHNCSIFNAEAVKGRTFEETVQAIMKRDKLTIEEVAQERINIRDLLEKCLK